MARSFGAGLLISAAVLAAACSASEGGKPEGASQGSLEELGPTGVARQAAGTTCTASSQCNDGLFCNGEETCRAASPRICVSGAAPNCSDGIACTIDTCSASSNACRHNAPDADHDGHPSAACRDADGEPLGDDCADNDAARFPGNLEVCDANRDEDCDTATIGTTDADHDGYVSRACCNGSTCGNDCNDARSDVHPINVDPCDGVDNDCDNAVDENCVVPCSGNTPLYPDADRDGFGAHVAAVQGCVGTPGFSPLDDDCDDTKPAVRPGVLQCNGAVARTCGADGVWTATTCPGSGACIAQPNGTGVCF